MLASYERKPRKWHDTGRPHRRDRPARCRWRLPRQAKADLKVFDCAPSEGGRGADRFGRSRRRCVRSAIRRLRWRWRRRAICWRAQMSRPTSPADRRLDRRGRGAAALTAQTGRGGMRRQAASAPGAGLFGGMRSVRQRDFVLQAQLRQRLAAVGLLLLDQRLFDKAQMRLDGGTRRGGIARLQRVVDRAVLVEQRLARGALAKHASGGCRTPLRAAGRTSRASCAA